MLYAHHLSQAARATAARVWRGVTGREAMPAELEAGAEVVRWGGGHGLALRLLAEEWRRGVPGPTAGRSGFLTGFLLPGGERPAFPATAGIWNGSGGHAQPGEQPALHHEVDGDHQDHGQGVIHAMALRGP